VVQGWGILEKWSGAGRNMHNGWALIQGSEWGGAGKERQGGEGKGLMVLS
jgi:hypothetical protein